MSAKSRQSVAKATDPLEASAPDYAAWFRRDAYYQYELCLIAIGVDPESGLADEFLQARAGDRHLNRKYARIPTVQPAYEKFVELDSVMSRSRKGGELSRYGYKDLIARIPALAFVADTGLFCEPFRVAMREWADKRLRAHDPKLGTAEKKQTKERPLLTRERRTALTLVIAMAKGKYGYDPRAARNGAIGQIARDIELLGLSLDQDTIRKWLDEATSVADETVA